MALVLIYGLPALNAAINEEVGKALGLVLLIGLAPRLVRSAYDGFIIGAFIGLGFQVFEDVLYVFNGATQVYGVDFAWDDMTGLAGGGALAVVLPFIIAAIELSVLFYALRHAAQQERAWTRDLLAPEVNTGVVDPALLDAVSGLREDRKAYRKHLHSRRKARHMLEGAGDLAHEIARAGGAETLRVEHARRELLRLRDGH